MDSDLLQRRLDDIRQRVAAACSRSGRNPESVEIVAVSKKHGPDEVNLVADLGQIVFGENRIQEARQKIPLCSDRLTWHLIGHLQRNKVRDAVSMFSLIHSVDSERLIEAIDQECSREGLTARILLEVNMAGDSAKYGFRPEEVEDAVGLCNSKPRLELAGLMTMPPFAEDPNEVRCFFRETRLLRDRVEESSSSLLPELSMGMTNDFEVAVEEGATLVRIGTAIFGSRSQA